MTCRDNQPDHVGTEDYVDRPCASHGSKNALGELGAYQKAHVRYYTHSGMDLQEVDWHRH